MESRYQDILKLLSSSFLFCGLEISQLQEIAQKVKIHTFRSGHILIEEDIINDKIFLLLEGLVKIYKLTPEGKEIFLAIEKSNDYLGIMDLADKPASATVETMQPTKALILPKKDLATLLDRNPSLWQKMYKITLAKLEEYRELQAITVSNDLQKRTYLFLKFLAQFFDKNIIPLSHEHLAYIVGATRPRVTEALHILREQHKINISSKKITLLS